MIKILHAESFQPLGKAIPKPAPAAPQSREIKPGIWQAPDGKLRTDFATGQSVAPAQKAAPVAPLPVVPNALGDGWIDHDGSPCPVAKGTLLQVRLRNGLVRDAAALEMCGFGSAQQWVDDTYPEDTIVAYRLIP